MSNFKDSWRKRFLLTLFMRNFIYLWRKGFLVALLVYGLVIVLALIVVFATAFIVLFTGLFDYQNMIQTIIAIPLIIFIVPYYCGCVAEMVENIPYKKKEE